MRRIAPVARDPEFGGQLESSGILQARKGGEVLEQSDAVDAAPR